MHACGAQTEGKKIYNYKFFKKFKKLELLLSCFLCYFHYNVNLIDNPLCVK